MVKPAPKNALLKLPDDLDHLIEKRDETARREQQRRTEERANAAPSSDAAAAVPGPDDSGPAPLGDRRAKPDRRSKRRRAAD